MAKHRPSMPMEDTTTEHCPGDPVYSRDCQDILDRAQWVGSGQPEFPAKVIVHHMPNSGDDVHHIYKRDGEE